jgi:hypothetical protein
MQNISATSRILGRKTSGAGDTEECTLSEVLDFIGSAAHGDILYRGSSSWARLGASTSGYFLQTQGAAANLQWASTNQRLTLLTSGTVSSAATLDIVLTAYTAYRGIKIFLSNLVPVTDNVILYARVSTNGGSSYDATGYSYVVLGRDDAGNARAANSGSANQMIIAADGGEDISNVAAEGGVSIEIALLDQTNTGRWPAVFCTCRYFSASARTIVMTAAGSRETAQDTDAIRFLFSSGNIASGNYAVYGLN